MNRTFKHPVILRFFLVILVLIMSSCQAVLIHKIKKGEFECAPYKCYEPMSGNIQSRKYPFKVETFQTNAQKYFDDKDSVMSIGARDGAFEFMSSFYLDSVKFYLVEIDTSCMSQYKIDNKYLPQYNQAKCDVSFYNLYRRKSRILRDENMDSLFDKRLKQPLTCTYQFVHGEDSVINLQNESVNKAYIGRTYHHFTHPVKIINECYRVLTDDGILIIGEHVTMRNRICYRHCFDGCFFKTEKSLIQEVESQGFKLLSVSRGKTQWREFIFIKNKTRIQNTGTQ